MSASNTEINSGRHRPLLPMWTRRAAMRSGLSTSNIGYLRSLHLLAAAVCLWPAIAGAQPPNPTDSDANGNTAAGTGALFNVNVDGRNNTAIGYNALNSNIDGLFNTASGSQALNFNTTGEKNTASGAYALNSNTTGNSNTASGLSALHSNTTGNYNTASGAWALLHNITGDTNTASGYYALYSSTTGNNNTASGSYALSSNGTGSNNTAVGYQALNTNTNGRNNVAVGYGALAKINGNNNIAVGINAGKATPSGSNNIYIGHPGSNASENRATRIGTNQTKIFVAGIAGVPLSGATVMVRSNGQLGVVASSARYKQDIRSLGDASGKLARLRPVSYRYKAEPQATHYGLIAEEVDNVMPELVVRDEQSRPESVQYQELIPLLLQQWKAQGAEIARQRALIERQQGLLERQQSRLERQEAALTELRRTLATRLADNTALKN
jgi:trimeric autotransporter adhesin